MGIEIAGRLNIKGQDQIKRVYKPGGGITNFIHNGWWQPTTESYHCCEPWSRSEKRTTLRTKKGWND